MVAVPRPDAVAVNVMGVPAHTVPETLETIATLAVMMGLTVTFNDCAYVGPQALLATTETTPPLLPAVVLIVGIIEVPVQPDGKVQV